MAKPLTLGDILASLNLDDNTQAATPTTTPTPTPTPTPTVAPTPTPTRKPRKKDVAQDDVPSEEVAKPMPEPTTPTPSTAINRFATYPFANEFQRNLRKFELWFGNPSTGKTTLARKLAQRLVDDGKIKDYAIINGHEDLNVMSMFKTTQTTDDGKWLFLLNRVFRMLTDELQERYIVIIDEINTLLMSVLKALQPILDDTKGTFDFEEKTYTKNPNCFFIATMNHKDMGTSPLPDAIKSRAFPVFFKDLDNVELSRRTEVPSHFIDILKRIYDMFAHMGQLHPFYNDVRQLKNMVALSPQAFKEYIIAQLELAQIDYESVIALSPEFDNLVAEYANIDWSKSQVQGE